MHEYKQQCTHLKDRQGKCDYWDMVCCTSQYPGGCRPIVEQCKTAGPKGSSCSRIIGHVCSVYLDPKVKWAHGGCPLREKERVEKEERKINPLKASKRSTKGKKE